MTLNNYDNQCWFCQVRTVGLIEAVVRFGQTFSGRPSESLHTQRTRSVWRQLEDNFLLCFTVSVPWAKKPAKDGGAEVMKYKPFSSVWPTIKTTYNHRWLSTSQTR